MNPPVAYAAIPTPVPSPPVDGPHPATQFASIWFGVAIIAALLLIVMMRKRG